MTRQINENVLNKKLLTAREAMSYIGIGKYQNFKKLVDDGEIGFKKVGRTKYFTIQELDRWLAKPDYLIAYTSEETSTTHTSLLSKKEKEYSLEKLLAEYRLKKQKATVSRGRQNYNRKPDSKLLANCPA